MALDLGIPQPKGRGRNKPGVTSGYADAPKVDTRLAAKYGVVAAVEETKRRMDQKWGRDRLAKIVSSEMAGKFASAMEKYTAAQRMENLAELERRAEVLRRGYKAMDEAAEALGIKPIPPCYWVAQDERKAAFVFVRDKADIAQLSEEITAGAAVWTIEEVIKVMQFAGMDWANQLKREFGGDTLLTRIGKPGSIEMMDEDIPF